MENPKTNDDNQAEEDTNGSNFSVPMRESGMEREDNLNMLRKKIDSLEKWKQDMIHNARKELTHLARIHKDLESKGRLVLMEQEERIQAAKETHQEELRRYREETVRLKQTIEIEKKEVAEKEKVVTELRRIHEEKISMLRSEEKEFRDQIDCEQKRLAEIEKEHDGRQRKFEAEIEVRKQRFSQAKEVVVAKMRELDEVMLEKKEKYTEEINRLSHELAMLQNEIDKKAGEGREEVNRLVKEREEYRGRIKEMEQRLAEVKVREEERIAVILRDHQTRYVDMEKEFEAEAKPIEDELGRLREAIREREEELEKFRDEKDREYQQAVTSVSQKIHELDDALYKTKAANRKELREKEEALQKHFADMDDEVLQKQQELHHLENNYMAEEALLRLQLDALRQHEMVLNTEDPERKKMFAERIQRLKEELAKAKAMADQEQEKYTQMRKNLEHQLDSERQKLQSQTVAATDKINNLDDRIIHLKAELRTKKEILRTVDTKAQEKLESIQDEVLRQKDANAKEANLLKDAFCDLANKLKRQRKEKSEIIEALEKECLDRRQIQQHDIENLQNLIIILKQQGEKVRNNLESELSDLVNNNAGLKEQFDKEVAQLQMDMASKVCGGGGQQNRVYEQLVAKFEELQQLLPKRRSELTDLLKGKGGRDADSSEVEEMEQKIKHKSEEIRRQNNPVFDEGGLAHKLYVEKTKHDALVEEYGKQKKALELELRLHEEEKRKRADCDDSKHVVHLRREIAKEVESNEALQKEITELEKQLRSTQGMNSTESESEGEKKEESKIKVQVEIPTSKVLDTVPDQQTEGSSTNASARDSSEIKQLKSHLDAITEEYDEKKADLEEKVTSIRSELTSTKRKSWKEKEAQDMEISKLEKLSEEERKKVKEERKKVQEDLNRKSQDDRKSQEAVESQKNEKPSVEVKVRVKEEKEAPPKEQTLSEDDTKEHESKP